MSATLIGTRWFKLWIGRAVWRCGQGLPQPFGLRLMWLPRTDPSGQGRFAPLISKLDFEITTAHGFVVRCRNYRMQPGGAL